ncbi:MAG: hypothetical protein K6357_06345 [Elusimicrobiota bacterium]
MRNKILFLISAFFLFSFNAFSSLLEQVRYDASKIFDNPDVDVSLSIPKIKKYYTNEQKYNFIFEMRQIMSAGSWRGSVPLTRHFIFYNKNEGWKAQAQNPGLEGFYWTKIELEGKYGVDPFIHHINDYFYYLDDLLAPISWTQELRETLKNLQANDKISVYEKNEILNKILENYISGLQKNMENYDDAKWIRKARIYEIFPRAYNFEGRRENPGYRYFKDKKFFRDFTESDFDIIKKMGFDTVWPMGILPIGKKGQTGSGGGSPYSISDHSTVNPDLGSEEDFRNFVKKAHSAGLKVIVDFVVNHTSLDSRLLYEDPAYFISYKTSGSNCPNDWFIHNHTDGSNYCIHHGGFEYGGGISVWIDTAQIDYSNPKLRKRMIDIVKGWVAKFDIDGYRVDMAYLTINQVFSRTWRKTMPSEEFYRMLISEVKKTKLSAAFIAEAYAYQEDLSAFGFDAIYSKYETGRIEGQTGWYDATSSGNNYLIQSSINRNAFLAWQKGGATSVVFIGNHDEPSPERVYGKKLPAALALTMLYPGAVMMYNGAEIGYDAAIETEHKPLPFSVPVQIDWNNGGNQWVKNIYQTVLPQANKIRSEMGDYDIKPIWLNNNLCGYLMISKSDPSKKKAIIANLSDYGGSYNLYGFSGYLSSGEYKIIDVK